MTKEEFLQMVDVALEKLGKEKDKSFSKVEYYKSVNPNGTEFTTANYQYLIAKMKVDLFRRLIGLPVYTRIQAMSDEEVAEYKRDKIDDIKLNIITVTAEIETTKKEIETLRAQHEEIVNHFAEFDVEKRNSAINEGKRIQLDIQEKQLKLNQLELKLTNLKSEQESISQMSSADIKEQLVGKISNGNELDSIIINSSEINRSRSLMAFIGKEPEKAMQMARLLTELANTEKKRVDIRVKLDANALYLPTQFANLIGNEYDFKFKGGNIQSTKRIYEIYQGFMEQFNKETSIFNSQFTEEKLKPLMERRRYYEFLDPNIDGMYDVDFEFLELHSDKFSSEELEDLKAKVLEREKLSKKIIKTKVTKEAISSLSYAISKMQKVIYRKIEGWYEEYNAIASDILGVNLFWRLVRVDNLAENLRKYVTELDQTKSALDGFKGRLGITETKLDNLFKQHDARIKEIKQQIRALGGVGFENTEMPLAQEKTEDNLNNIASATAYTERKSFIGQVLNEAQNQANIREAELRGISLDELLQMKNQSETVLQPQSEDDLSHGMKK